MGLARLSISTKLYAIFALLATASAGFGALAESAVALWQVIVAGGALLIVVAGAIVVARQLGGPVADLAVACDALAKGKSGLAVPHAGRTDEIGALARSMGVLQEALRRNGDFSKAASEDAQQRAHRQKLMATEIARFSQHIETTLSELGRISDQMLDASGKLAAAADEATAKTSRAEAASSEASANVSDIASAADELSASVNEIDRQVAQSNVIAGKAVSEAEATNTAVKELGDAASRIGDVVKLITEHRRADQLARAECDHRGGARRRSRSRLCGGCRRGEGARGSDQPRDRRNRRADRGHAAGHHALDSRRSRPSNRPSARSAISRARSPRP